MDYLIIDYMIDFNITVDLKISSSGPTFGLVLRPLTPTSPGPIISNDTTLKYAE